MKKRNTFLSRKAADFTVHGPRWFVQTEAECLRQIPATIKSSVDTKSLKISKQTRAAVSHLYEEVMNGNLGETKTQV